MTQRRATVVAASGQLGSGFLASTLDAAMALDPVALGCDAGSTDGGPYFLGAGVAKASRAALARDLRLMLRAARRHDVPMLVGSAGTGGATVHLAQLRDILVEVAAEERLHFTLATIDTQIPAPELVSALDEGRVRALPPWDRVTAEDLTACDPIVAQIGTEHFIEALDRGADVVLAGRATDAAIFAAVPERMGLPRGPVWHAAKTLECGAACVEQRAHPDCMVATVDDDGFTVTPPNPEFRCTTQSVAAQSLYENADPFRITEPSGVLDTSQCQYAQLDARSVRVTGSRFDADKTYDVKLEGARLAGFRTISIGGIRDPYVLEELDDFLASATASITRKVADSLDLASPRDYRLDVRVYGRDAVLGPMEPEATRGGSGHEVGVLLDVVARDQGDAHDICALASHTMLHHPIARWSGLLSNLAFPFSPPNVDVGPVYEFGLQAVYAPANPLDVGSIHVERL